MSPYIQYEINENYQTVLKEELNISEEVTKVSNEIEKMILGNPNLKQYELKNYWFIGELKINFAFINYNSTDNIDKETADRKNLFRKSFRGE